MLKKNVLTNVLIMTCALGLLATPVACDKDDSNTSDDDDDDDDDNGGGGDDDDDNGGGGDDDDDGGGDDDDDNGGGGDDDDDGGGDDDDGDDDESEGGDACEGPSDCDTIVCECEAGPVNVKDCYNGVCADDAECDDVCSAWDDDDDWGGSTSW